MLITRNHSRGYSLLELVVALGLFSLMMLVVMGVYLALISLDRQSRSANQLSSTLTFAVESMARSMRTGKQYACNGNTSTPNCPSGGESITFMNSENQSVTYLLKTDGGLGQCIGGTCTSASAVSLTDNRIVINDLRFYVRGVGSSDAVQPQVTFALSGTLTTDNGESTTFSMQTGATQRYIDI